MCYRPRPDLKRTPAWEETERKLRRLEAELALLRQGQGNPLRS
jgi:hypothetical protein